MKPMNANELLAGLALARPVPITAVVTDSRKVQPGCIFVCFPERVDGHDYAAKAYQAGAEYVIANHPVEGCLLYTSITRKPPAGFPAMKALRWCAATMRALTSA